MRALARSAHTNTQTVYRWYQRRNQLMGAGLEVCAVGPCARHALAGTAVNKPCRISQNDLRFYLREASRSSVATEARQIERMSVACCGRIVFMISSITAPWSKAQRAISRCV
jgi:hypothetical protein